MAARISKVHKYCDATPSQFSKFLTSQVPTSPKSPKHEQHKMSVTNKSNSHIPLAGLASDGWSTEDEATATCFCGEVQLVFVSLDCRLT